MLIDLHDYDEDSGTRSSLVARHHRTLHKTEAQNEPYMNEIRDMNDEHRINVFVDVVRASTKLRHGESDFCHELSRYYDFMRSEKRTHSRRQTGWLMVPSGQ